MPFGKCFANFGWRFVARHASMISRSRCVPTRRTSLPFSRAGNASALPIMPEPMIVIVAIFDLLLDCQNANVNVLPRFSASCKSHAGLRSAFGSGRGWKQSFCTSDATARCGSTRNFT